MKTTLPPTKLMGKPILPQNSEKVHSNVLIDTVISNALVDTVDTVYSALVDIVNTIHSNALVHTVDTIHSDALVEIVVLEKVRETQLERIRNFLARL